MSSPHPFSREEPLPGYTTTELIGRGGFGEVWKAVAPGGVPKAIKLVFGDDPSRSELELRSLNRIKDVRHPLILSIDRIEVIDGTLIIVTELGDCNLKEYCYRFRAKGQPGIPQEELLKLVKDAAEALDYIYTEHSLQHLDVKPENFLLFGKRLKIADFGVVKHIYERGASLMHGMTPIYSAPESLGGKPSRFTDQYSLAIVYQEMLTGQLPFDGISPGRLATQHLMEPPDLELLPARQQPIVARALSKDPQQRFESCQAFVEELERAVKKSESVSIAKDPKQSIAKQPAKKRRSAGVPLEPSPGESEPELPAEKSNDSKELDARLEAIFNAVEQGFDAMPPTVFIGIGGTAANVIHQLRLRINDRLGQLRDAPSIKLLAIDSDVGQLNKIHRDENVWKEIETIAAPLRKPGDYREQHAQLKRWINRRWLYNIPRDQSTDGIRALGRLALVTNYCRTMASIERAIRNSSSADSAVQSSESLEIPFVPGRPRVILVASVAGGTGGGMLFDVAYAVRGKLKQAGFDDDQIEAVLLHATPRKGRDKSIANTYATLKELRHFSRRGNYFPGDSQLGIEAFHGNNRTFSHVDFLHLGDNLDTQQWQEAADDAAEFLYCSLFGYPHRSKSAEANEALTVRTISVEQLGAANRRFLSEFSLQLCQDVVEVWCGRELADTAGASFTETTKLLNQLATARSGKRRRFTEELDEKVTGLDLSVDSLKFRLGEIMHQELGKSPEAYLESLVQEVLEHHPAEQTGCRAACLAMLDRVLTSKEPRDSEPGGQHTLQAMLAARSESLGHTLAAELRTWLQELVNDPETRVDGSLYAAERVRGLLQDQLSALSRKRAETGKKADQLRVKLRTLEQPKPTRRKWFRFRAEEPVETVEAVLLEYAGVKMDQVVLSVVYGLFRTIDGQVGATIDQTQRLFHDLTRLSRKFDTLVRLDSPGTSSQSIDESVAWYVQGVRERLLTRRSRIVAELDRRIGKRLEDLGHTLKSFLDQRSEIADVLFVPMRELARDVVSQAVAGIHCALINAEPEVSESKGSSRQTFSLPDLIEELIQKHSKGPARKTGRISVMIPRSAEASRLESRLESTGRPISVFNVSTNSVTLLDQTEDLTLGELIESLTHGEIIYRELAERLHSREDVDWTSMDSAENAAFIPGLSGIVSIDKTAKLDG